MKPTKNQGSGRYVETIAFGEKVSAFLPNALPPEINLASPSLLKRLNEANRALGRLDGIKDMLIVRIFQSLDSAKCAATSDAPKGLLVHNTSMTSNSDWEILFFMRLP